MTTLSVTPADGLLDEPRRIFVKGLQPSQKVELSTRTLRGNGQYWVSSATYIADASGQVDLERDAPVSGSYAGVSASGLLWSQRPEASGAADVFPDDVLQPLVTQISLEGSETSVTLIQRLASEGVTRREVREDGLVGTLFTPPGVGPHPAVIVLNGSGGGINEPRAALYASRGYAALALGYFKAPGLSPYISNTPLEYFVAGLAWVRREVRPAHDFVALSGQSRGGELVLLLGSMFPEAVSAVIGYVPSALVHGGQAAADPAVGRDGPAWLYQGQPLVHLWNNNKSASWAARDAGLRNAESISTALQDHDAVRRVAIEVEKIRGPVLLLSAGDDAAWPSALFSRMAYSRLKATGHPWPVQHLSFEHAGHTILLPNIPSTYSVDGTPAANAEANEQSWLAVKAFLDDAVNARAAEGA
ncbi:acyl-CoA thioesterase/bile acid-CoA:amino acid N-acyltransferase family protein [Pseudomonas quasicaspiana]|uniref:acyl-CoA thioesterase/bile acid-CoA:amino acid N-acyltransferase family protein n=1 Tax=Pseudomonas quasicaspiana TaxID=2829821 RepID=UPI001E2B9410|nr:acyl-CoA thioesterase/bile acid-CoA:amino acid N-acyltransferase family protein [Pseudomonas quasicaspiana]MCD5970993.1 acyl-CoA thioesterase/BAAT N-terminal domain-containing protein [Pseudomonas quasicaspiana]